MRLLILFIILFIPGLSHSQSVFHQKDFIALEADISTRKLLSEAAAKLDSMLQRSIAQDDMLSAARCYHDIIFIKDLRSEDSLFFKNSAVLDELLQQPGAPLLKGLVHLLSAKRLDKFLSKYRWQTNRKLFERNDIPVNYATFSNDSLAFIVRDNFEKAKVLLRGISNDNIEDALWLSGDPYVFLFKPALYDIIMLEQIRSVGYYPGDLVNKFFLNDPAPAKFLPLLDSTKKYSGQRLYAEWARHYANTAVNKTLFIEALALRGFTRYAGEDFSEDEVWGYESYLQQLTQLSYAEPRALGVYMLFNLWKSRGDKYEARKNYYGYNSKDKFADYDSSARPYYAAAVNLFEKNNALLDSFAYLKNNLEIIVEGLKKPSVSITTEDVIEPGKKIPVQLSWRNVPAAWIKVIRANSEDSFGLAKKYAPVYETRIDLGNNRRDHQPHSSFIVLDALPLGNYYIVVSDSAIGGNYQYQSISVSELSVLNDENDDRFFVLNRKTGMPAKNARAVVTYKKTAADRNWEPGEEVSYRINSDGYFTAKHKGIFSMYVLDGQDTLTDNNIRIDYDYDDDPAGYGNNDMYDKDEYDSKVEYYLENMTVKLFTDRDMYRPGQTVYFKGIVFTKDALTGGDVIFTKNNIKVPFYKKGWLNKYFKKKLYTALLDPFQREADSLFVSINEYGSVSGSFVIPAKAATGEWTIDIDDEDEDFEFDETDISFRVEEYKRPSFEIIAEKPKKMLMPLDSFSFAVTVRSFAGVQMNGTLVKYKLRRSGNLIIPGKTENGPVSYKSIDTILLEKEGFTDAQGRLLIPVNDSALAAYRHFFTNQMGYDYSLDLAAIDATGENHETSVSLTVKALPVAISVQKNKVADIATIKPLVFKTSVAEVGPVNKPVRVKIYRLDQPGNNEGTDKFGPTDTVLFYSINQLAEMFPSLISPTSKREEKKTLVFDTLLNGEVKSLQLPQSIGAGTYQIDATCENNGTLTGEYSTSLSLFDSHNNTAWKNDLYLMEYNAGKPGEKLKFRSGHFSADTWSIYQLKWVESTGKHASIKTRYETRFEKAGLNDFEFTIPSKAMDRISLVQLYIINGVLHKNVQDVYVNNNEKTDPEITIEKYRTKLTPGAEETFSVAVKTNSTNTAAELLTTMYDASLDKLADEYDLYNRQKWDRISSNRGYSRINADWPANINAVSQSTDPKMFAYLLRNLPAPEYKKSFQPLWWLDPSDYTFPDKNSNGDWNNYNPQNALAGRVAGLSVQSSLNEVVVVGYGSTRIQRSVSSNAQVIRLRGESSTFGFAKEPLVLVDGVPFAGKLSELTFDNVTDAIILKDAEATALYGSRAANGVLVISTKGKIELPQAPPPPVQVRRNFNETAFFFPQVHADPDGYFRFSFKMPESVTEWKWKMLAHTKASTFAYKILSVYTQLPLMVQPNMPRILYQGDKIILRSRISNLDSSSISGKISCTIEDAVTGEDISKKLLAGRENSFTANSRSNTNSEFNITVPADQLNPIRVKIVAYGGGYSDGEEHLVPILSKKIFITKSVQFAFEVNSDSSIATPALPVDAEAYGLGMFITPKPQSALINSLPFLANYSFDCAEQLFNKMLAHAVAVQLMRKDTALQRSYALLQLKQQKDTVAAAQLPDELADATMPWLGLANKTSQRQEQLAALLDTLQSKEKITAHLNKLISLQNPDGGMAWFKGGRSNDYISFYILQSFASPGGKLLNELSAYTCGLLLQKLIPYCDSAFSRPRESKYDINYLFSRSYWSKTYPLGTIKGKIDTAMSAAWRDVYSFDLPVQAKLAIASLNYYQAGDNMYQKAIALLESTRQMSINDMANGIRWKDFQGFGMTWTDDISVSAEETVALLLEAFEKGGMGNAMRPGIIKWLLGPKKENEYRSTKAAAMIINVLLNNGSAIGSSQTISRPAAKDSRISNDLLQGKLFSFERTGTSFPANISLTKENTGPASGNINYYYFTATPDSTNDNIRVTKRVYRISNIGQEEIKEGTILSTGDKLLTSITIISVKPLNYVFINDNRAACQEPVSAASGYEYGGKIYYYKSVSDAGFRFFAEQIPGGLSMISYETVVSQAGIFYTGITELQCMYRPEVKAYAPGGLLKVER